MNFQKSRFYAVFIASTINLVFNIYDDLFHLSFYKYITVFQIQSILSQYNN